MDSQRLQPTCPAHVTENSHKRINRRTALKFGIGALGLTASTLSVLEGYTLTFARLAHAAPPKLPAIQYDISEYLAPAHILDQHGKVSPGGVAFRFGPVYTLFLTAQLKHTPTLREQQVLSDALDTIESVYPFSPTGIFTFVSYGLPYFKRLPPGVVSAHMPRLLSDHTRFALEEAVPGPTDVSPQNPRITKQTFNVPVVIEANEVLFTMRSDSLKNVQNVANWLQQNTNTLGGQTMHAPALNDMFNFTSSRLMFAQQGLPRKLANTHNLPYASSINHTSPMWMGFADQQVDGSGPAPITTFEGNTSARLTTAKAGDYLCDGSIQHLSHVIQDLAQFYAKTEPYTERCQYMFRSNPIPSTGNKDQFTDGGGSGYFGNVYKGADDAKDNAQGINTYQGQHRMGHLSGLQRSSRAADHTPMHMRMDGPGFDAMDVPGSSNQPKLQFTIFVPTADFFATMRRHAASLDLVEKYQVDSDDDGLERFITATRRQNFLVPPRAHRAFPLLEM